MSTISPTNTFTNAGGNATDVSKKNASLSMEDFMNLLTVQLANQDPLNPMNDRDFFAQMAQLGTVQGMDELKQSMQVTQAQSLMGKTITASRPNADGSNGIDTVTGLVTQLTIQNGNYTLGIQDSNGGGLVQVNLNSIQSVSPQGDLSGLQSLIGKDVTGIATVNTNGTPTAAFVEGIVQRVFSDSGQNFARVKLANGTSVDMSVGDIRSIAPAP